MAYGNAPDRVLGLGVLTGVARHARDAASQNSVVEHASIRILVIAQANFLIVGVFVSTPCIGACRRVPLRKPRISALLQVSAQTIASGILSFVIGAECV